MGVVVKVGEAKTRLSELLAMAEAGGDVVIARGDTPIARLAPVASRSDVRAVIEQIKEAHKDVAPMTMDEILRWRDEARR